jgi:LmbE family N-acetylglucosaminyl deacetylase
VFHAHHKKEDDLVQSATRKSLGAKVIDHVVANHVLVLSPHPDDDVFACGGLLTHLSRGGSRIKTLYFFDGAKGNKDDKRDEALIEVREREAVSAVRVLGHSEVNFLRLRDDSPIKEDLWVRILEEISTRPIDLILVPDENDWHPDHVAVNQNFQKAYAKLSDKPTVWYFGVWGFPRPNIIFPIDSFVSAKKEAARCHKSQLKVKKYDEAMLALNEYVGKVFAVSDYAEIYTQNR